MIEQLTHISWPKLQGLEDFYLNINQPVVNG